MNKKKVLILCPTPRRIAATQRLKYEQYLGLVEKEGYDFTISSFQTKRFWDIVDKPGCTAEKMCWTLIGYLGAYSRLMYKYKRVVAISSIFEIERHWLR